MGEQSLRRSLVVCSCRTSGFVRESIVLLCGGRERRIRSSLTYPVYRCGEISDESLLVGSNEGLEEVAARARIGTVHESDDVLVPQPPSQFLVDSLPHLYGGEVHGLVQLPMSDSACLLTTQKFLNITTEGAMSLRVENTPDMEGTELRAGLGPYRGSLGHEVLLAKDGEHLRRKRLVNRDFRFVRILSTFLYPVSRENTKQGDEACYNPTCNIQKDGCSVWGSCIRQVDWHLVPMPFL